MRASPWSLAFTPLNSLYLIFAITLFAFAGCAAPTEDNEPPTYDWRFINQSSYRVYVEPNGTDFDDFFVDPGNTVRTTTETDYIQFAFAPAPYVQVDPTSSDDVVRFINR